MLCRLSAAASAGAQMRQTDAPSTEVIKGSAAERAGLREWDVVIEVNGQIVEEQYFDEVVRLIKDGGTALSLLVVDGLGYQKQRNSRRTGLSLHCDSIPDISQDAFV